ncbi:hypothetical protein DXG03_001760 [Asterophora parasitica]|uniref:Peptidase C14 caspase domain-containing protein n=1 Tax=Asterophora parasitica TaxID=117018 RepID=A0A9P7G2U6_9AGAR|nr:hypothetical protein DXG03_001760 [Asterophora parasitica]
MGLLLGLHHRGMRGILAAMHLLPALPQAPDPAVEATQARDINRNMEALGIRGRPVGTQGRVATLLRQARRQCAPRRSNSIMAPLSKVNKGEMCSRSSNTHSAPGRRKPFAYVHSRPPALNGYLAHVTAIKIGINYFGQNGELAGCINDVHNITNFLTTHYGYKQEDIVILTDDLPNPRQKPTHDNIVRVT